MLLDSETPGDKDALALFPHGITLEVPPGTKWCYANLGFALLGEIVARIEGAPIAEVMAAAHWSPSARPMSDPAPAMTATLFLQFHVRFSGCALVWWLPILQAAVR